MWWPAHDEQTYSGDRLPVWDTRAKGFTDSDTGTVLPTFDQACEHIDPRAHVARFGEQVCRRPRDPER